MPLLRKKKKSTFILDKREFQSRIKEITGLSPCNISIYEKALIHRSATFTREDGIRINNERLEFLGDAILDAILSDYLFNKFPQYDEGKLSKIRSRVVNQEVLNKLALSMGIDSLLINHMSSNNKGRKLYGDALEALIGSVFLDFLGKYYRGICKRKQQHRQECNDVWIAFEFVCLVCFHFNKDYCN